RLYERIADHCLVIEFDQMERRPLVAAWRIAHYLTGENIPTWTWRTSRKFSKARVRKMTFEMKPEDRGIVDLGYTYHDRETMFHRRHVSDPSDRVRDPGVAREIRAGLARWVDEQG